MKVKFNGKDYKKDARSNNGLGVLCFDIFKYYLQKNRDKDYTKLKEVFDDNHCTNNYIVQNQKDWEQKTENTQKRYFEPIDYNGEKLYFSTQWGNNGGDCDNVNTMINFAKEENYNIEVIESDTKGIENDLKQDKKNYTTAIKMNLNIKNIILYGSPGVGKTHNTNKLINLIESGKSEREIFDSIQENGVAEYEEIEFKERVKFITFHQSFGYEDFIEGFRPNIEGNIELVDGVFKAICKEAEEKEENYYLVIDEINRGNISKIFGELITLIEEDKRDKLEVTLPYSKQPFKIPSNLYIIGTMNSTDKSIALIDIALRRRFTFLKMEPNANLIENADAREIFEKLNKKITETLGEDYQIGHSYFMGDTDLDFVLDYKIIPLLEEYFYGDADGLTEMLEIVNANR